MVLQEESYSPRSYIRAWERRRSCAAEKVFDVRGNIPRTFPGDEDDQQNFIFPAASTITGTNFLFNFKGVNTGLYWATLLLFSDQTSIHHDNESAKRQTAIKLVQLLSVRVLKRNFLSKNCSSYCSTVNRDRPSATSTVNLQAWHALSGSQKAKPNPLKSAQQKFKISEIFQQAYHERMLNIKWTIHWAKLIRWNLRCETCGARTNIVGSMVVVTPSTPALLLVLNQCGHDDRYIGKSKSLQSETFTGKRTRCLSSAGTRNNNVPSICSIAVVSLHLMTAVSHLQSRSTGVNQRIL
jgi:hypothetical protein